PSCGGSGGSGTQCSTANTATGCPSGQACTQGKDGMYGCSCSVSANTGCTGGEVCLAGANGDPACFCDTDAEAGCTGGKVCEEVMGSTPACFTPVTVGGQIFDLSPGSPSRARTSSGATPTSPRSRAWPSPTRWATTTSPCP